MSPHEADRFRNAATVTVAITFTVAGGARVDTARRRARRMAGKLADAAVRAGDVVAVSARLDHTGDNPDRGLPVSFTTANTYLEVDGTAGREWIDPDHERATRSLATANTAARRRHDADVARRIAVDCANRSRLHPAYRCGCVYCRPAEHLDAHTNRYGDTGAATREQTSPGICVCGQQAATDGRCDRHADIRIVALDTDPPELHQLAQHLGRTITHDHERNLP